MTKTRVKQNSMCYRLKRKMSQLNGWYEACTYTSQYVCHNLHNCDISHKLIRKQDVTGSRSEVQGSCTNGRIRNIPSNLGAFLAISQNTLILMSHVLENLMKMLKFSSFAKIGKCQILAKYEK